MLTEKIELRSGMKMSKVVHGFWRLLDWNMDEKQLENLVHDLLDLGVSTFDHADIYGNHECEAVFGKIIKNDPGIRHKMQLVTKCGIMLTTDKFPDRRVKYYDFSKEHIIHSVEKSLQNFGTDHIDLLLLHRPSWLLNPEEVAACFSELHAAGKVLHFGVSNYLPAQFDTLDAYCPFPLATNQVEMSPVCHTHLNNGNLDYFLLEQVNPMAWSPVGGGDLFNPKDDRSKRILTVLEALKEAYRMNSVATAAYSWLAKIPCGVIPVTGTSKIERVKHAIEGISVEISTEDWFKVIEAYRGSPVP